MTTQWSLRETNQLSKLQTCLKDIRNWMTCNFLLLNSDKIEIIIFGPKHHRDKLSKDVASLNSINLASSTAARNLGVILSSHIKQMSRTVFFHLRNIAKIRPILSQKDTEKLVHAFVTSRLDYCNSLLSGCTNTSLKNHQLIQNAEARILSHHHISKSC